MTGKELLLAALRGEETARPAWVPFVGCHGGHLIGVEAEEYLRSRDHLVAGLTEAERRYRPDGLPVMFDLQLEAEILGCSLHWGSDVPPSVCSHPLQTGSISDLPPFDPEKGRMPIVLGALDTLTERFGDRLGWYGLICGPFTLALHLLGHEIFLKMFDDPDGVLELMEYTAEIGIQSAQAYLDHGATVIAVVDPMTSQIGPEHFTTFVAPALNRVFDAVREQQALSSIFVCGDVTRNLEVMCQTRADNISVDEQIDMSVLRGLCETEKKSFGGNMKLTSVLLLGTPEDARREAVQIMDVCGTRGFVLAPGCDLPYHTPLANLDAVADVVHDRYQRDVVRASVPSGDQDAYEDIEVPVYDELDGVVIDVITLDSTSCAPCQYMMEAVERAAKAASVRTFINEHKIKVRQGLGMMQKLGVQNLPTICIDGEVVFASIIPDQRTLVKAIETRGHSRGHA